MTTKEFHLLKLRVYDGDTIIYEGMSEDVPKEISEKQIKVEKLEDKVLVVKIAQN